MRRLLLVAAVGVLPTIVLRAIKRVELEADMALVAGVQEGPEEGQAARPEATVRKAS